MHPNIGPSRLQKDSKRARIYIYNAANEWTLGGIMIPSLHSCRPRGPGLKSFRIGCFVPDVLGGLSHSSLSIEGTFSTYWVSPSMHVKMRS